MEYQFPRAEPGRQTPCEIGLDIGWFVGRLGSGTRSESASTPSRNLDLIV